MPLTWKVEVGRQEVRRQLCPQMGKDISQEVEHIRSSRKPLAESQNEESHGDSSERGVSEQHWGELLD